MKKKWQAPAFTVTPVDISKLGDVQKLSDAELKIRLEQAGYPFKKRYQASANFIHRKIADSDVLVSVGGNIANYNGYVEINKTAATLWETLQAPRELSDLEQVLEKTYDISHETAVEDVLDFIKMLLGHNMVEVQ